MNKPFFLLALLVGTSLGAWGQDFKRHAFGLQAGAYDFNADLTGWGVANGIHYSYGFNPHISTSFFLQNAYGERTKDTLIPPDYDSRIAGGWTLNGSLYGQQSPFDLTFQAGLLYGRTVRMQYNAECPTPPYSTYQSTGMGIVLGAGGIYRFGNWGLGIQNQTTVDWKTQDVRAGWYLHLEHRF